MKLYTIAIKSKLFGLVPYWKRHYIFHHWIEASSNNQNILFPIMPRLCFETATGHVYSVPLDRSEYRLEGYVEIMRKAQYEEFERQARLQHAEEQDRLHEEQEIKAKTIAMEGQ